MNRNEEIRQAVEENPELPEYFIREVIEARHNAESQEDLEQKLRLIFWRSFFIDNGEQPPADLPERLQRKDKL